MAERGEWSYRNLGRVASTQLVAKRLASEGARAGLVVMASSQTSGRGRKDRSWLSPKGGLYMSIILRPARRDGLQLLPLVGTFAVAEGIRKDTGLVAFVRWPNDVLVGGRKAAGIIAESAYRGNALAYAVLGIGINANVRKRSLGKYAKYSTSLREELGVEIDMSILRDKVLQSLTPLYAEWERTGKILGNRRGWFSTIGRKVEITRGEGKATYTAEDVGDDGALIVTSGRKRHRFRAEDVERLKEL